jgi:hypothetical protein
MNPAYHGEIGIDPATGSIQSISMVSANRFGSAASIQLEYGAVEIGGSSYICPVRSVALSRTQSIEVTGQQRFRGMGSTISSQSTEGLTDKLITRLNDVLFTDYHVFRSESRILPVASTDGNNGTPGGAGLTPEPSPQQK